MYSFLRRQSHLSSCTATLSCKGLISFSLYPWAPYGASFFQFGILLISTLIYYCFIPKRYSWETPLTLFSIYFRHIASFLWFITISNIPMLTFFCIWNIFYRFLYHQFHHTSFFHDLTATTDSAWIASNENHASAAYAANLTIFVPISR